VTADVPSAHAEFLRRATDRLREDPRVVGVAAGGSYLTRTMDEFSDLDLVVAVEPGAYRAVLDDRPRIASSLGPLLAAFTGEHVGEPRVLICLYGAPLLHVDLKFVSLPDVAERVEDPAVLWERDGRLSAALRGGAARFPAPDRQWIEDRFWVWVHYGAGKIGRGELFEAQDMLAFLRGHVLGPLALQAAGARPSGVRRIETSAPERARQMQATLAAPTAASCAAALRAAAHLYRAWRAEAAAPALVPRKEAEAAAMAYLDDVERRTS
jgi:predicted nucleotidyltransferase